MPATKKVQRSVVERVNSSSRIRSFRQKTTEAFYASACFGNTCVGFSFRLTSRNFNRGRPSIASTMDRAFRVTQPKGPWDGTFEHGEFANMGSPSKARVGQLAFTKPYLPSLVRPRRIAPLLPSLV